MSDTNEKSLSRRKAIVRFGALALAAYAAPSLTTMSMAHASSSSGPSPRSAASPRSSASQRSPASAPSPRSQSSRASRPNGSDPCSNMSDAGCGTTNP